jgi:hypothetical protein
MIYRGPQYEEVRTELRYRQGATVHKQVNPNVRGVTRDLRSW